MVMIKTNHGANGHELLTSQEGSAKVHNKKSCCTESSGKEPVMTVNRVSNLNSRPMMGFCYYYYYFKACFFAGLFRRSAMKPLSDV